MSMPQKSHRLLPEQAKTIVIESLASLSRNALNELVLFVEYLKFRENNPEEDDIANYFDRDTKDALKKVTDQDNIQSISKSMQERFDLLAGKNTEGKLTENERVEYIELVEELEELMLVNAEKLATKRAYAV